MMLLFLLPRDSVPQNVVPLHHVWKLLAQKDNVSHFLKPIMSLIAFRWWWWWNQAVQKERKFPYHRRDGVFQQICGAWKRFKVEETKWCLLGPRTDENEIFEFGSDYSRRCSLRSRCQFDWYFCQNDDSKGWWKSRKNRILASVSWLFH